ncbi:hypothetical protein KXD40_004637 [Peronospora effusa]|uniref:Uncharacterized protein n=1 Tax=Peronospora effusa TaxID=542832 RepID=A0A425C945_9STRA|nr:hypothetical protein DD237_003776 [Peronospora effusa]UIZ28434.1 hypothetical protein KXD40_004637 [Peronospora effusa]
MMYTKSDSTTSRGTTGPLRPSNGMKNIRAIAKQHIVWITGMTMALSEIQMYMPDESKQERCKSWHNTCPTSGKNIHAAKM